MSIDMSQFYQVFFEETQEHLASMETLLLQLDIAEPDSEQLNAIFRAAHSIKGSSGTFGFNDLTQVTHILENLLDRIRKDELALRAEMIDAFLDAGDLLKVLVDAHRGEGAADPAQVDAICTRLKLLTSDQPGAAPGQAPAASKKATTEWMVSFVVDLDAAGAQAAVENLVAELASASLLECIAAPGGGHCNCRIALGAAPDQELVRSLLEFIARSDSIRFHRGDEPSQSDDDAAGAYGFFTDDEVTPAASAAKELSGNDDDAAGAYGFFTDDAVPAAPATAAVASGNDGDGYGFFTDLPDVGAVPPAPTLAATAGSEGDGFGFFVDVPAPPAEVGVIETLNAAVVNAAVTAAPTPPAPAERPGDRRQATRAGSASADTSIRVGIDKVDQLINLVGELVITQAMLTQSAQGVDPVLFERLFSGLGQLERNTRDLQESVMSIRMMPMSVVFSRFPRVIRDLSQKLGKQVELKTIGESTELDKSLIERITDPLTHLIRNSLDHGIEMPEVRVAKGKQATGTITLKAYQQSGNIVIEVGDDGAGLNRAKILAKAKERGLPAHEQMTDADVWMLIFEAGFSTAEQITEVSGRGVGMDVVKRNINGMGGRVEIESMMGVGTRMTVRLPLTLAILDGMSVAVGKETYIIPLGYVIESLQVERDMIKSLSGVERLIQVRGEYLPVIALYDLFRIPNTETRLDQGIMVILEADGIKAALFVDALVGQHQVVIKSLEANYRKVPGIGGATIMGDGHVALILDISALVQMARTATAQVVPISRAA